LVEAHLNLLGDVLGMPGAARGAAPAAGSERPAAALQLDDAAQLESVSLDRRRRAAR
jgi:hypothetical protein